MIKDRALPVIVLIFCCLLLPLGAAAKSQHRHRHSKHHHKSFKHKAAWTGAGLAIGRLAGPVGSLGFGAFHHRHELKAGGHTRNKAVAKIGAPVAVMAAFGPAGSAGYEVFEHRHWIKYHMLPHKHHHNHLV